MTSVRFDGVVRPARSRSRVRGRRRGVARHRRPAGFGQVGGTPPPRRHRPADRRSDPDRRPVRQRTPDEGPWRRHAPRPNGALPTSHGRREPRRIARTRVLRPDRTTTRRSGRRRVGADRPPRPLATLAVARRTTMRRARAGVRPRSGRRRIGRSVRRHGVRDGVDGPRRCPHAPTCNRVDRPVHDHRSRRGARRRRSDCRDGERDRRTDRHTCQCVNNLQDSPANCSRIGRIRPGRVRRVGRRPRRRRGARSGRRGRPTRRVCRARRDGPARRPRSGRRAARC